MATRFEVVGRVAGAGGRPCVPLPDRMDVRSLADGTLLAENIPAECAAVGPGGIPAPLVPQSLVGDPDLLTGAQGGFLDDRDITHRDFQAFLLDQGDDCAGPCFDASTAHLSKNADGCYRCDEEFAQEPLTPTAAGHDDYCRWRSMIVPPADWWDPADGLRCGAQNPSAISTNP